MKPNQYHSRAEQFIIDKVDEYGWQVSMIESDGYNPSFAYTIGLHKTFGHPELIMLGLGTKLMGNLLNVAARLIKDGDKIELNRDYNNFLDGYACQFVEVEKDYFYDYLGYGLWFNQGVDFRTFQLVWPNKAGHFPWNKGEDADFDLRQPLLDRNVNFKFFEKENLGVITTKYVLDGTHPIKHVHHDEDGDWQFLCGTTTQSIDLKLISLKSIVVLDPSIINLFNLTYGKSAWRKGKDEDWQRDD